MHITKKHGCSSPTRVIDGEEKTSFIALAPTKDANYWVSFTLTAPIDDTYIFLPACVYDGNRFNAVHIPYAPMFGEEYLKKDIPVTMTEVPRLAPEGDSFMDVTTGDLATPCVCVLRKSTQEAFLLFTEQGCHSRNFGITLEQLGDQLEIRLTAPSKRRLVYRWYNEKWNGKDRGFPSLRPNPDADPPIFLEEGTQTDIPHRIYQCSCRDIPALHRIFFKKREELYRASEHASLPFSAFWDLSEERLNSRNYDKEAKFYHNLAIRENPSRYQQWQPGWVGGAISTLPLLADGSPLSQQRAVETLEFAARYQSAKGFFYGIVFNGNAFHDCFGLYEDKYNFVLTRKQADMVYFLFKQIDLMKKSGIPFPESIMNSAVAAANALVEVWEQNGQLGQFINAETGEIMVRGSTSGGVAPAGLCAAAMVTGNRHYLDIAREIARYYYETAISCGVTTGGPGEILQAPDSESIAGLVESYITLYEIDGTEEWLQMSKDAVHQLAGWVVPYDYDFPPESRFGKMDIRSAGSVWANVQNKHSAPGICTHSAASLLKLFRFTGERSYLNLMQQIAHFSPQVVSRPDRPMFTMNGTKMYPGEICERVNLSDWEGNENVGDAIGGSSCWPEVSLMLTWCEVPGVYVLPEEGILCISDHITGKLTGRTLVLENPTDYPARVKILVDSPESRLLPLGLTWQDKFRFVEVPVGATVTVLL